MGAQQMNKLAVPFQKFLKGSSKWVVHRDRM